MIAPVRCPDGFFHNSTILRSVVRLIYSELIIYVCACFQIYIKHHSHYQHPGRFLSNASLCRFFLPSSSVCYACCFVPGSSLNVFNSVFFSIWGNN